ncbi:MAG: SCO family protein [Xanthobacteraceae bacterium]|jgi:protein SCO1/2
MEPRFRYLFAGALVSAVIVGAAASLVAAKRFAGDADAPQALPLGGHFSLAAPDGRIVTDRSFSGKWLFVYFGYTSCPDACPTALSDMTVALEQLGARADEVQPLFITVDPGRDTPRVLADYVGSFDPRFVALRGTPDETAAVAGAYHVFYAVRPLGKDAYAVDHSSFIYVVEPQGGTVKLLTGDLPGHNLADELRRLIR